jgi:hypothetical protein
VQGENHHKREGQFYITDCFIEFYYIHIVTCRVIRVVKIPGSSSNYWIY